MTDRARFLQKSRPVRHERCQFRRASPRGASLAPAGQFPLCRRNGRSFLSFRRLRTAELCEALPQEPFPKAESPRWKKAARTFHTDFLRSGRKKFPRRCHSQGRSVRTGAGGTCLAQAVAAHPPRGNPVSLEGADSDLLPPPAPELPEAAPERPWGADA